MLRFAAKIEWNSTRGTFDPGGTRAFSGQGRAIPRLRAPVGLGTSAMGRTVRALGYKHNVWPMQNLAESRLRWAGGAASVFALQARLLGIGGLLPMELSRLRPAACDSGVAWRASKKSADDYVRKLWDVWWREREVFDDCILPRTIWKFHGLRPANHPQRRLALAAHWIASGDLVQKLERWCAAELSDKFLLVSLRKIFEVKQDEFWSWHWTFRSARLKNRNGCWVTHG